jgi:hypothetical protein
MHPSEDECLFRPRREEAAVEEEAKRKKQRQKQKRKRNRNRKRKRKRTKKKQTKRQTSGEHVSSVAPPRRWPACYTGSV